MNRNTLLVALCGIFALGLLAGCGGARPLVDDPTISLHYLKDPSEENLTALSKAYAQAINRNRKERVKQPGLFAEYAITLALLGDQEQANQWFNREVADFPSSRDYVVRLKQTYCPAFASDQTQATDMALEAPAAAPEAEATGAEAAVQQVIDQEQAALAGDQSQPQTKQKAPSDKSKAKKSSKKKGKKPAKKAKKK